MDARFTIGAAETDLVAAGSVESKDVIRLSCGIESIDNFFSGGLVPGQIVVISGVSGAGKTTFLLQMLDAYEASGHSTGFGSNEESRDQLKIACDRINLKKVKIAHAVTLGAYLEMIEDNEIVVIDALQGIQIPGETGNIEKKALNQITAWGKEFKTAVILISHANKDGSAKGNSSIGHQVDTRINVQHGSEAFIMDSPRVWTIEKTRMGRTGMMCWDMTSTGFDVHNPFMNELDNYDKDFFKAK